MHNTHELIINNDITSEQYLQQMLELYPYDIEEALVFSLLQEQPIAHPSLLKFIDFMRNVQKYRILNKETPSPSLERLFETICKVSQRNKMVLHTHQFQFDATLYTRPYRFHNPYAYLAFHDVLLIHQIQIQLPLSITMCSKTLSHHIKKVETFLFHDISFQPDHFYALSIQIADRHGIVFLPRHHIGLICACASLYQISTPPQHPDFLLLYGLNDTKESSEYYYDTTNQLYLGLVRGNETYDHFDLLKNMITTLDNEICRKKHDYPLHAAMLCITYLNKEIGVVLCGKQQSGKSEIIDALWKLCEQQNIACTKVFDDQGTLHYLDDDIYATGTQIGAYLHVNALPRSSIFENISASVLLKEQETVTYLLTPFTNHEETCRFHKVNVFLYLDRQLCSKGFELIEDLAYANELMQEAFASTSSSDKQSDALLQTYLEYMYVKNIPFVRFHTHCQKQVMEKTYQRIAKQLLQYLISA